MENNKLYNEALDMLKNDGDLFCQLINELDAWDGFADGYRCEYMDCLDEFFSGNVLDLLTKIDYSDFSPFDDFVVFTIYGIISVNDELEWYRDHFTEEEVLDHLIHVINSSEHIYIDNYDFKELIQSIVDKQ